MEEQVGWRAHADFMNSLEADGFVVVGGPLEGTGEVLLIVRADGVAEIHERLGGDPWGQAMLFIAGAAPWTVRLGRLD